MRPRLLISNDDGADSPFLPIFLEELSAVADLEVVVPATEQSWIGRAYSRHRKLTLGEVSVAGFKVKTIDGTPSDCVNIALAHLCKPDAVVSGINIGQNIGIPLLWSSGTFSAAAEGACWGYPAFALSMRLEKIYYEACRLNHKMPAEGTLEENLRAASEKSAEYILDSLESGFAKPHCVCNVNFPIRYAADTPFKQCVPTKSEMASLYERNGDSFEFKYAIKPLPSSELTDFECLESGCACHSRIFM